MKNWTLVFDLDGTLIDTAPDLVSATNHVMKRLKLRDVSESEIRPFVGHGALAMVERAAAAQGRVIATSERNALFDVFIEHYTTNIAANSRPYPGALAALEACKREGARLAVCTNKLEAHARLLFDALQLTDEFAAITGRDTLAVCKPHPGHLLETVARAGGTPAKALMIGDSETDIKTAQAAGIPVIAVDFGYSIEPVASFAPTAVISHFSQLVPTAEALMGPATRLHPSTRPST